LNKQWLLAIPIGIVVIFIAVAYFAPSLVEGLPGFEANYYANVDYEVRSPDWMWTGMSIRIMGVTLEKKIIPLSVGPLYFWPEEYRGKVVVESLKNNTLVERIERDVDVSEGWFQNETVKRMVNTVKLGPAGSGEYTIRVSLFNLDGVKIMQDQTTRSI